MPTISNTPRPGFVYDSTDDVWYPIGTGTHNHSEIAKTLIDAKGDLIVGTAADTVSRLAVGATNGMVLTVDSAEATGLKYATPAAGGKVLQVVNATYSTITTSTSATYADTGITATITPSSATSKVLVFASVNGIQKDGGSSGDLRMDLRLVKDSTQLIIFENRAGLTGNTNTNGVAGSSTTYLDSPATTSATVYKVQFARGDGNGNVRVQSDNCTSTITLMEIGA